MTPLTCRTLLTAFKAEPYALSAMPEEITDFGEEELPEVVPNVELAYEMEPDAWQPIPATSAHDRDPRLPRTFVDGAVTTIEIAGSVQDGSGLARSIRAGQIGVGAIRLDSPARPIIEASFLLAVTTMGYSAAQLATLRQDLQRQPRPFDLVAWQADSDAYFKSTEVRELALRDVAIVRRRLRRHVTDEMLGREQQLVQQLGEGAVAGER